MSTLQLIYLHVLTIRSNVKVIGFYTNHFWGIILNQYNRRDGKRKETLAATYNWVPGKEVNGRMYHFLYNGVRYCLRNSRRMRHFIGVVGIS